MRMKAETLAIEDVGSNETPTHLKDLHCLGICRVVLPFGEHL